MGHINSPKFLFVYLFIFFGGGGGLHTLAPTKICPGSIGDVSGSQNHD